MSDISQGPGWWQASDGKWYPPEQAPGAQPPAGQPPAGQPPAGQPPMGAPPGGQPAAGGAAAPTVGEAFNYGWAKFQQHIGPILIAMLVYVVAAAVILGISVAVLSEAGFFGQILVQILFYLVGFIVQMAIIRAALKVIDGQTVEIADLFSTDYLAQYIIASILVSIATGIGLILCIIPGIVVWFLTAYFGYFVLDRGEDAIEAIKSSAAMVQANVGLLIIMFLASMAAYFVGALLCGIGLIVAIPVIIIAQAYMYRRLSGGNVAA